MNSLTAADEAGISYRQIDHWIRQGYVKSSCPGSGYQREITRAEGAVVKRIADLLRAGFRLDVAAGLARHPARLARLSYDLRRAA